MRERALKYFETHSGKATSEVFGISRKALYDWRALKEETGDIMEMRCVGRRTQLQEVEKLRKCMEENADKSSRELARIWSPEVHFTTFWRWLRKLGYTFKKNVLPSETGRKPTRILSKAQKIIS